MLLVQKWSLLTVNIQIYEMAMKNKNYILFKKSAN